MNIFESKWRKLLEELLLTNKKHVKDETQIREIIGVHERIDNPYNDSMLNINHKQFAEAIKRGAFNIKDYPIKGEALYDYVISLDQLDKILLVDEDSFIYTYPERLQNYQGRNQLIDIVERLKQDIGSNRAVAVTFNPFVDNERADIPCLQLIQALVRSDKLILSVYFRSNDLYGAFPSNMMFLTYLGMKIANELGVTFDYIDYHCSSLHIYETDYKQASKVISVEKIS